MRNAHSNRRRLWFRIALLVVLVTGVLVVRNQVKVNRNRALSAEQAALIVSNRQALFDLLQPVALANCKLERFGEANDGGYLLCANLLDGVQAGYSYGISGYDKWGCDVSTRFNVTLHQYDCFNTEQPNCPDGRTVFHAECVGPTTKTEEGRLFDTVANQLAKNGDANRRVVVKMDVEGAEWDSLMLAPADTLDRIDQLAIEFHRNDEERFVKTVRRLKQFFHVAHLHFNNYSCLPGVLPFPSWAYEALLVSRRLAIVDPAGQSARRPHPLDSPNNPKGADCQAP
jgi:hypothetical protein